MSCFVVRITSSPRERERRTRRRPDPARRLKEARLPANAASVEEVTCEPARGLDRAVVRSLSTCQWARETECDHHRSDGHREDLPWNRARTGVVSKRQSRALHTSTAVASRAFDRARRRLVHDDAPEDRARRCPRPGCSPHRTARRAGATRSPRGARRSLRPRVDGDHHAGAHEKVGESLADPTLPDAICDRVITTRTSSRCGRLDEKEEGNRYRSRICILRDGNVAYRSKKVSRNRVAARSGAPRHPLAASTMRPARRPRTVLFEQSSSPAPGTRHSVCGTPGNPRFHPPISCSPGYTPNARCHFRHEGRARYDVLGRGRAIHNRWCRCRLN